MKIVLVINQYKPKTLAMAEKVALKLQQKGLEVLIDKGQPSMAQDIDLAMVLGGDGTILRAFRQYAPQNVPILGVNMGKVGFLSSIDIEELDKYIDNIVKMDFAYDPRMVLQITICQDQQPIDKIWCLNEVVIKTTTPKILRLGAEIDGQRLEDFYGDGVIIATSTGSTAYSLSAGGPICDPELPAMVITPIASYTTSRRPLVIKGERKITFSPHPKNQAMVCCDGQAKLTVDASYQVIITKAEFMLNLVNPKKIAHFSSVEIRLKRNPAVFP
jgi:NAD+ kinase